MTKYVYPAIFTEAEEGGYVISFPDVDGCYTQGDDLEDGIEMAEDVLALVLYGNEVDGKDISTPSNLSDIKTNDKEFATLIKCDTMEYRKMYNSKSIKKTLTIPSWLNEEAEAKKINFSGVLQSALKKQLHID